MERVVQVGDRIRPITLSDVDGKPVELSTLLKTPLIIPLVRYYGCMPCQAYLRELDSHREQLEDMGIGVIGVGGAADYQARHLMKQGVGFPLLLDPEHRLYHSLNIRRIHWWKLLSVFTWWRYVRAARRARQGRITDHPLQAPGLVILDQSGTVRFLHRGETLGDYPLIRRLLDVARQVADSSAQ